MAKTAPPLREAFATQRQLLPLKSILKTKKIHEMSFQEVQADIHELESLEVELKRLREQQKRCRTLRDACADRILAFMEENDYPGLQTQNRTFQREERKKRVYVKKSEKLDRFAHCLRQHGAPTDQQTINALMESLRGDLAYEVRLKKFEKRTK